jgi:hypothetical protein
MVKDFPDRWFRLKRIRKDGTFFFEKVHNFSDIYGVLGFVYYLARSERECLECIVLYDDITDKQIATFYS